MKTDLENRLDADAREMDRDFPIADSLERRILNGIALSPREERPALTIPQELALAALFVVAVALLVIGIVRLRAITQPGPVGPMPSASVPGGATCLSYGPLPGSSAPVPVKMVSATTGWAPGALQTTDGGAHWQDVSPSALRDDAPSDFARRTFYPPGYVDFNLDPTHAWIARSHASSASCFDHLSVFATTDGGRTWQQSAPINLQIGAGLEMSAPRLFFSDPLHGWVLVVAGPGSLGFVQSATRADLYRTSDGGLHWTLIANMMKASAGITQASNCMGPFGGLLFASAGAGWISLTCQQSAQPEMLVTHDGGATWNAQQLPRPATRRCPCFVAPPVFFDAGHGIVQLSGDQGPTLLATSDGGRTWQALPPLPDTGYSLMLSFRNANEFWDLVTPPGWTKGNSPTRDWLYRSTDGGRTWQLVQADLPIGYPVGALQFVDANHGFVAQTQNATTGPPVGPSTEVLATSDGGHTWKLVGPVSRP